LLNVGLQQQSLHLAAFDLFLLLNQVEWEGESRSRGKPALQRREQVACFLLSGYHDAWRGAGMKRTGVEAVISISMIY